MSDIRVKLPILDVFRNAAKEAGIPSVKDFNTGDNFGCGYFQVTEKNGLRCSTAVGYLNPIKHRQNLKIETNCHVEKINFEGKKATSVSYWKKDKSFNVKSNKEIILSAGSIGSTQLLQVSGIGEASKLKKLGFGFNNDLVGVGKNL